MLLTFTDIDHVFIQTSRHIPHTISSHLVYTSESNKDLVITDTQLNMFKSLSSISSMIPVTARSLEQLQRLSNYLPFHLHKICSHGSVIYDEDDNVVQGYLTYLKDLVKGSQEALREVVLLLLEYELANVEGFKFNSVGVGDTLLLVEGSTSSSAKTLEILEEIKETVKKFKLCNLVMSYNDTCFSITVKYESYKQLACKYLVDNYKQYQGLPILGLGDSKTDLPFLNFCDFAAVPQSKTTQIKLS